MVTPQSRTNTYVPPTFEEKEVEVKYSKLLNSIGGYLKGKGMHKSIEAMEFAKEYHKGTRKNGITPEFQHQIEIALYVQTLKELRHEEDVFCAVFLHDVREDYNVSHEEIVNRFGTRVANAVEKLSKVIEGVKKPAKDYFEAIATCPIASVVKLADRVNNVSTMTGVFTIAKQKDYLKETEQWFIPLAKTCRKKFPDQSLSYYNATTSLKMIAITLHAVIAAEEKVMKLESVIQQPQVQQETQQKVNEANEKTLPFRMKK